METTELKLVGRAERTAPPGRRSAIGLAAIVLAAAAIATGAGADRHRAPLDAEALAREALEASVTAGFDDPAVRESLGRLRHELGRRPLDARLRVVYAGLLLGLGRGPDDAAAAASHALRAVELAPVTVPVVRSATLVLAHAGRPQQAAEQVRGMFGYDSQRAADLLARVEPMLTQAQTDHAVPADPRAALSWATRLRRDGRERTADGVLERAVSRWPEDLALRERLAGWAVSRGDWPTLRRIFEETPPLPETPEAAALFVYRCRSRHHDGDPQAAREDLDRALSLDGDSRDLRVLAGDAASAMGDLPGARDHWNRALHRTAEHERDLRVALFVRLARLEESTGRRGTALRHWRAVLRVKPDDAEARQRASALDGPGG